MPIGKWYALRGHEVVEADVLEAALLMNDTDARTVRKTSLGQGEEECEVSTVFLTMDHNFTGDGPPIVFETLVFGGPMADHQWRYATWDEAVVGHEATVELVRQALTSSSPVLQQLCEGREDRRTWHERVLDDDD